MYTNSFSEKNIHLVAFDIRIPVNYGGAIDIFYKIKSLAEKGIKVHLHCFQYGREAAPELEQLCSSVHYYPRRLTPFQFFHRLPYIVKTRASELLLKELTEKPYPVLFEGLHSCYYLDHPQLNERRKIVRTHNIEHDYYTNLGKVEKGLFKKLYFFREARKLLKFENILAYADGIAAISRKDQDHFREKFPDNHIETISAFHPFPTVEFQPGTGSFALYHGSLEVGENNQAALFLISEVFNNTSVPLVIAGNKPTPELVEVINHHPNVSLRSDLSTDEIYQLVKEAQVNILPTFQATGIKLKLLSALFTGRHCIVNQPMVENTGLESMCHICNDPAAMISSLETLMNEPFSRAESEKRKQLLEEGGFCNNTNVDKLIQLMFRV